MCISKHFGVGEWSMIINSFDSADSVFWTQTVQVTYEVLQRPCDKAEPFALQ